MTEQNEPSMEAILASIRNILAEDEDETPEPAAEKEQQSNPVAEEEARPEKKEEELPPPEEEKPVAASEPEPEPEVQPVVPESEEPLPPEETSEPVNDVLDLTEDMIVGNPSSPAEEPARVEPEEEEEDDFTPEPVIPQEPMKEETLTDLIKETAAKQIENDMLLAEPTVMAATESLSHLRDIAVERQLELGNGTLTIETIVRETLKPYLKEWLDAHLPDIVERVVRKEVAHIMDRLDLK